MHFRSQDLPKYVTKILDLSPLTIFFQLLFSLPIPIESECGAACRAWAGNKVRESLLTSGFSVGNISSHCLTKTVISWFVLYQSNCTVSPTGVFSCLEPIFPKVCMKTVQKGIGKDAWVLFWMQLHSQSSNTEGCWRWLLFSLTLLFIFSCFQAWQHFGKIIPNSLSELQWRRFIKNFMFHLQWNALYYYFL